VAGVYVDGDIDADIPDGRPWDPIWLASACAVAPGEPADDGSERPGDPVAQRPATYLQMGHSRRLSLSLLEDQAVDHAHGVPGPIAELLIEDLSKPEIGAGIPLHLTRR
jgi:hypothetical protein